MIPSTQPISPLRQRMLEDMRMRKLEPRTQEAYIRAVRKLVAYLKRSPDAAMVQDLRNFQLHLVDTGSSPVTFIKQLPSIHGWHQGHCGERGDFWCNASCCGPDG